MDLYLILQGACLHSCPLFSCCKLQCQNKQSLINWLIVDMSGLTGTDTTKMHTLTITQTFSVYLEFEKF